MSKARALPLRLPAVSTWERIAELTRLQYIVVDGFTCYVGEDDTLIARTDKTVFYRGLIRRRTPRQMTEVRQANWAEVREYRWLQMKMGATEVVDRPMEVAS